MSATAALGLFAAVAASVAFNVGIVLQAADAREMLAAGGFKDVVLFERNDADMCVGTTLEEAIDYQLLVGPSGEVVREAGEEGKRRLPEIRARLIGMTPLGRFGAVDEVGGVAGPLLAEAVGSTPAARRRGYRPRVAPVPRAPADPAHRSSRR